MSIFDKFQGLAATRAELSAAGANPFNVVLDEIISATEGMVRGRKTILAGTNNYLGLTFDPQCIDAACQALQSRGTGTTGSRMANGTYADHVALEHELSEFFGCPGSIVFSTGYLANLAVLSTLQGQGGLIVLDSDCHASIYDGCRLGGSEVIRFRHNDPADLDKRLRRLGDRAASALVVVEGIYSMLGDTAPLAEIVEVKRRHGAYLLVDEAHSLGVLGSTGRGLAEAAGVEQDVDFIVGTFSKSLGSIGGFCVSKWPELEQVRYAMRPYIFTASSSPAVIASTRAALRLMRKEGAALRKQLWDNAHRLYKGLEGLGFALGPETSPVVPVVLGESKEEALASWVQLLERGVYVNLVMPPATPSGRCLLRCSCSAAHTAEQIDTIIDAFGSLRETAPARVAR
ncbi:MAG: aminotransferase class I/II-fold pyridoxal phosphate-dependent enzyme [Chromatiales bacterium]|jgi:8-amino-7-oxononanoate synthase